MYFVVYNPQVESSSNEDSNPHSKIYSHLKGNHLFGYDLSKFYPDPGSLICR